MPTKSFFNQMGKVDVIAVLPSGFFIFLVFYFIYKMIIGNAENPDSFLAFIKKLAEDLQQYPASFIFILFASYLSGSIIRAMPVRWVDRIISFKETKFPYPEHILDVLETLKEYSTSIKIDTGKLPDIKDDVPMHVFNFWKDALCINSPEGFVYYQTFEARARFFAGMFWAGFIGVLGSAIVFFWISDIQLLPVSLVLIIAFGSNFMRVRRQEARALVIIYSAYLQKE